MVVIGEYAHQYGDVDHVLRDELDKAREDDAHALSKVADACDRGDAETATREFIEALLAIDIESPAPLLRLAMALRMKMGQELLHEAIDLAKTGSAHALRNYPEEIKTFAWMALAEFALKSKAGSKKGLVAKEKCLVEWVEYERRNPSASANVFAGWYFKMLNGDRDAEGKKTTEKVPAERTIARWVNEYKDKR